MHVQGFDSMDDAFAAMKANEDAANAGLLPGQIRLRDNVDETTYWVQVVTEYGGLVIYGRCPAVAETQKVADFDVAENRARGYLTGVAYSAWEPEGEHGDTHVSQVIPITLAEFQIATDLGYPDMSAVGTTPEGRLLGALLYQCQEAMKA